MTPEQMREFFAQGMLCSVMAAIDLRSVNEAWAQSFFLEDLAKCEPATDVPAGSRHLATSA